MILVDSSVWIDFIIDPKRLPVLESRVDDCVTCSPVIQEVLQGFADPTRFESFKERLLSFPILSEPLTSDLFVKAAHIYRDGRRRGYTIRSAADCLIAAIAIENDIPIWHRDRDFTAIAKFTPLQVYSLHLM